MKYDDVNYSVEVTLVCRPLFPVGDFILQIYHYFGENWINVNFSYKYNDDFQKENTFVITSLDKWNLNYTVLMNLSIRFN